jgi:hypothetical protein
MRADTATGLMEDTSPMNQMIVPGVPTMNSLRVYEYGRSMLAADVEACRSTGGFGEEACGVELLVGAPGNLGGGPGAVFQWHTYPAGNQTWILTQALPVPSTLTAGAGFGCALAGATEGIDPLPWRTGGVVPPWLAISAPGAGAVFIYSVDPATAPYLTQRQVLTGPPSRGFGKALAVGDFDGDMLYDLAVGAPDADTSGGAPAWGQVWLFRGQSGTAWPYLRTIPLVIDGEEVSDSVAADANQFGYALAGGDFIGYHDGDGLLVGAPMTGADDDGGYCQYVLAPDYSSAGFHVANETCCSVQKT